MCLQQLEQLASALMLKAGFVSQGSLSHHARMFSALEIKPRVSVLIHCHVKVILVGRDWGCHGIQIVKWKGKKKMRDKKNGLFIDDTLLDVRPFSSSNNALLTECK